MLGVNLFPQFSVVFSKSNIVSIVNLFTKIILAKFIMVGNRHERPFMLIEYNYYNLQVLSYKVLLCITINYCSYLLVNKLTY